MPKAPPGGKPAAKGKAPSKGSQKTTVGKPLPAPNLKLAFGGGPTMGQAYGSQDPTVDANGKPLPGSPGSPLLKGATDPFAGTPYAGMSPYQIAQQIVNQEIKQQAAAISASMAQQQQYNQNALSVIAQLGQQLQSGAGQFATNYNNSLANMPGGGGGTPDPGKAFQGFSAGYQAAQNLINQQGQPGGPSQAMGNGAAQQAADAQHYTQTAIATNPFAVLPAAYGRMATMDANLLAANQAAEMSKTYGSAISDLYAGADKAIFDEFNQIKAEFDAANGSVTAQQALAAQQQAKASADRQKTYQWQYGQAAARAKELTSYTGEIYIVDPKTLQVTPTGKLTLAAVKQGVTLQIARTRAQLEKSAQANLQNYRAMTLAQKKQTAARQQANANRLKPAPDAVSRSAGVVMLYDPASGQYVPALTAGGATIKYKATGGTSPNAVGSPAYIQKFQKQHTDLVVRAQEEYQKLTTGTVSGSKSQSTNSKTKTTTTNKSGHITSPKMTTAQAKTYLTRKYLPQFIRIANALKAGGQFRQYTARQIADYWLNQLFTA